MNRRDMGKKLVTVGVAVAATPYLFQGNHGAADASTIPTYTIPEWTLPGGVQMPTLALNTVGLSTEDTERAVGYATTLGMTHIDFHPGKERDGVAAYLRQQQQQAVRSKLFLNTKIRKAPPGTTPTEAADQTRRQIHDDLQALRLPYVDMLMLRDSPDPAVIQAQWNVLEQALEQGQTRSIGVINFCQSALEAVLQTAKIVPAVNYYMLHVGMGRDAHGLRSFGESRGIRTFAYGAVGEPGPNKELLSNPLLRKIGRRYNNKTPEQVALRWALQTGAAVSVRPTLSFGLGESECSINNDCYQGLAGRASSFDWTLTESDMNLLDSLTSPDDNPTLFSSSGCPGAFVMP
ncbi:aldo/keto reductase family protein [Nitzschia inconspicua]|uniref:Aldo/keto reductase family protein n=1 Tax=Nitzschia inconspicua TaxID=303405 RepID=A0A9K3KB78_9STRA|nr:aldo/keto reductase family protein [Nitzschia inconspicua]